jgi:zona occludens toxin
MITLITGEPGNGKTAYAVDCIRRDLEKSPRAVFVWGVKDLKLPHTVCPPVGEWTRLESVAEDSSLSRAVFDFPSGSLVIIDECQDVFRVRASSAKVPPYVAALETHRHQGLDFYLITQKPSQIDTNVRGLVGRHIHLRSNWSGRHLLEWAECRNPLSRSDCAVAITRPYSLPKSVFTLYTSATEHTGQPRRKPTQLLVVGIAVVLLVCGGFYVRHRIAVLTERKPAEEMVHGSGDRGADATADAPRSPGPGSHVPVTSERKQDAGRLVASTFVRVGSEVIQRDFHHIDADGRVRRVEGGMCVGEGNRAFCRVGGSMVGFAGARSVGGDSPPSGRPVSGGVSQALVQR